jgi:hypothetical protein
MGAIAGVLGAYMVLYPWARVHTAVIFFYFIRLITIPALVMIGFWFVLPVYGKEKAELETFDTADTATLIRLLKRT